VTSGFGRYLNQSIIDASLLKLNSKINSTLISALGSTLGEIQNASTLIKDYNDQVSNYTSGVSVNLRYITSQYTEALLNSSAAYTQSIELRDRVYSNYIDSLKLNHTELLTMYSADLNTSLSSLTDQYKSIISNLSASYREQALSYASSSTITEGLFNSLLESYTSSLEPLSQFEHSFHQSYNDYIRTVDNLRLSYEQLYSLVNSYEMIISPLADILNTVLNIPSNLCEEILMSAGIKVVLDSYGTSIAGILTEASTLSSKLADLTNLIHAGEVTTYDLLSNSLLYSSSVIGEVGSALVNSAKAIDELVSYEYQNARDILSSASIPLSGLSAILEYDNPTVVIPLSLDTSNVEKAYSGVYRTFSELTSLLDTIQSSCSTFGFNLPAIFCTCLYFMLA